MQNNDVKNKDFKNMLNWLCDPTVFCVNRQSPHSSHIFYTSEEKASSNNSDLFQSLNGSWQFKYSENFTSRPENFYKDDYDTSAFDSIEVPSHIELSGYGQIQYINTMYPWDGRLAMRPPEVCMDENPVGSYVKYFDLNDELLNKRVCISFKGVEKAFYVWINGNFVGYAEDTFTPSDFDLTPYIKDKGNKLCVEVYKQCSASWIEDQDFFRFSGIFRDVELYAKPKMHVEDLWLKTNVQSDGHTGTLKVIAKLSKQSGKETELIANCNEFEIDCIIYHQSGEVLFSEQLNFEKKEQEKWQTCTFQFPNVKKWCNSAPNLYTAKLIVKDKEGSINEVVCQNIGFRRVEIKDKMLLLNGEKLVINGVNRHEWCATKGRSITADTMHYDIHILKKNNINAVRTSHYPNQSVWYDMCDENGIYVMDEANLESHGSWQKMGACEPSWNVPANFEMWRECVVDRARNMFERDKNHVSVLFWSCGNESYAGTCIAAMTQFFHDADDTRPVHYEGVFWNREYNDISDIESRMYETPKNIEAYLQNSPDKPFILCEYMHNMGNSLGAMESYIDLLQHDSYSGGFIWDYKDQALFYKNKAGKTVLGYGGDFGERPTDYAFSGNGLLFADGAVKPAMQEVRFWYDSPENRQKHIVENEKKLREAVKHVKIQRENLEKHCAKNAPLKIIYGDVNIGVIGEGFSALFSKACGGLVSLKYSDIEWIYRAPRPAFWRACTENDLNNDFAHKSAMWASAELFAKHKSCEVTKQCDEHVEITYVFNIPCAQEAHVGVKYVVNRSGVIDVCTTYTGCKNLPQLPLFGIRLTMPFDIDKTTWTGLCGETYPDRKRGGVFGTHSETPHITPYLVPQECGCHEDTVLAKFTVNSTPCAGNESLKIVMREKPFAFSALPNGPFELESATHIEELAQTGKTTISVFGAMRGVGGIDTWGADVEEKYHISAQHEIKLDFSIMKG